MQVYYRGVLVEADRLTSNGQVFYQIEGEFIPDFDVALPGDPRFNPESPPPPPGPNPELSQFETRKTKTKTAGKPPKVDDDPDPPQGGDLSDGIHDPRNR